MSGGKSRCFFVWTPLLQRKSMLNLTSPPLPNSVMWTSTSIILYSVMCAHRKEPIIVRIPCHLLNTTDFLALPRNITLIPPTHPYPPKSWLLMTPPSHFCHSQKWKLKFVYHKIAPIPHKIPTDLCHNIT